MSAVFHSDSDIPDSKATHMVTQMGQFLDHDITLTPETHAEDCCEHAEEDTNCFPINLPSVDPFYSSRLTGAVRCLEFTRSTAFCEEEEERSDRHSHPRSHSHPEQHEQGKDSREQINGTGHMINSFIHYVQFFLSISVRALMLIII